MALSIGEIEATIRLRDEMSERLNKVKENMHATAEAVERVKGVLETLSQPIGSASDKMKQGEDAAYNFGYAIGEGLRTAVGVGAVALAGLVTAVAATAAVIVELGEKGSDVNDVSNAFDVLTQRTGVDAPRALAALREGVKGTMSDFDLMRNSNRAMSGGLNLTEQQFGTVAASARLLAKQGAMPVSEAFNAITLALTTGMPRQIQRLGLAVEMKGAMTEETNALKANGQVMDTAATKAAVRNAMLQSMAKLVKDVGEEEIDFKEKIEQGKVALVNWVNDLEGAVAASAPLNAALVAVGEAIMGAFGDDQQSAIEAIVGHIETAARWMVNLANVAVTMADYVTRAWDGIKVVILGTLAVIVGGIAGFADGLQKLIDLASRAPGGGFLKGTAQSAKLDVAFMQGEAQSLADQTKEAASAVINGRPAFQQAHEAIDKIGASMDNAAAHAAAMKGGLQAVQGSISATMAAFQKGDAKGVENGLKGVSATMASMQKNGDLTHEANVKIAKSLKDLESAGVTLTPALKKVVDEFGIMKRAPDDLGTAGADKTGVAGFKDAAAALAHIHEVLAGLTDAQKLNIKNWIDMGMSTDEIAKKTGLGTAIVEHYKDEIQGAAKFQKEWNETVQKTKNSLAEQSQAIAQNTAQRQLEAVAKLKPIQDTTAKTLAETDIQHAQAQIDLAKATGASWQQVYAMEEALDKKRLQATLENLRVEFMARTATVRARIEAAQLLGRPPDMVDELTLQAETDAYEAAVGQQQQAFVDAEAVKRAEALRTHNTMIRLWETTKNITRQLGDDIASNLGTILFGFGHDMDGSLHKQAKEAEDAYKKIAASGKSTPKEIQDAFERMRDAEDAANYTFAERFKDVWLSVKKALLDIFNQILKAFVTNFLMGMVGALRGQQGAMQSAWSQFFSGFGGGGQGGGFGIPGLGGGGGGGQGGGNFLSNLLGGKGSPINKLLGLGGGGGETALMTAEQVAAAPALGAAGTVAGVTLAGSGAFAGTGTAALFAGGGVTAGGTASGVAAGTAGVGAGAGGGFMGSMGAFFTNPWTAVGAAAVVGGIALYKHLTAGKHGNDARDKFLAQFAALDRHHDENNPPGFYGLADWLAKQNHSELFDRLIHAHGPGDVKKAEAPIIELAAAAGRHIKSFMFGGFIPAGAVAGAIMHGGGKGELAAPMDTIVEMLAERMGGPKFAEAVMARRGVAGGGQVITINAPLRIDGVMDANTVEEVHRKHLIKLHKRAMTLNTDGIADHSTRVVKASIKSVGFGLF